jgi:ABC-2 type transport system ATP-binding protein
VVDAGRVIAEGTSEELKSRVGGERLEATVAREDGLKEAAGVLERYAHGDGGVRVDAERRYVGTTVAGGPGLLAAVVRNFDAAGVQVDELGLHRPTLDDVFLTMTCSSPSRTTRRSPTLQRTSGPSTTSRSHERGDE